MWSRHRNIIPCPDWYIEGFPSHLTLDGELWMGHNFSSVDLLKVIVSKRANWSPVGYYIFDLPSSPGTFEDRMKLMDTLKLPVHAFIVKNIQCTGTEHSYEYLDSIMVSKGEGVMARQPRSEYIPGMTASLLKVKVK